MLPAPISCLLSDHLGGITGWESEEIWCLRRLLKYLCLANHGGISSTFPSLKLPLISQSLSDSRSWSPQGTLKRYILVSYDCLKGRWTVSLYACLIHSHLVSTHFPISPLSFASTNPSTDANNRTNTNQIMPYSSARPSNIPPDLPNNQSIEYGFAATLEFAAAPNNDDDMSVRIQRDK